MLTQRENNTALILEFISLYVLFSCFLFFTIFFQNGSTRTDDAQCHTTVFLNCTSERSFFNLRIESNMEQTNASEHAAAASLPVTANKTIIAAILGIVF